MKEILISIQPQWVEKILNAEKTIEIRKTKPKCELPCKVYIYCTQAKPTLQYFYNWENYKPISDHSTWACGRTINVGEYGNGKVVAEFTLNEVETIEKNQVYNASVVRHNACLNIMQLHDYIKGKRFHAWHIDNLKIYDTPKELSEFSHYIPNNKCPTKQCGTDCEDCPNYDEEHETCLALYYAHREIKRPPQSWCYVEKE